MRRRVLSLAAGALVAGCLVELVAIPRPLLVWNVTHSAPIGLYRRVFADVGSGAWVLVRAPRAAADLASSRGYLPRSVPMVKRIAASSGDKVCRAGQSVTINGHAAAQALWRDSLGRALPVWTGCVDLKPDQIFLITTPPTSFDSRYFGPVPTGNVIERIAPLWTF
jgi:conjugative transfer signal peptidase TraF